MGPLLFCATIQPIVSDLSSELNCWYMDDGTIGGEADVVRSDLTMIIEKSARIGLTLNKQKCEILNANNINDFAEMKQIDKRNFTLLGSPITQEAQDSSLKSVKDGMALCIEKLQILPKHYAYKILQTSFGAPQLVSILRSASCFNHAHLIEIDALLKNTMESLFNTKMSEEAYHQASMPIKFGGLGIRQPNSLALSAFLASFQATQLLRPELRTTPVLTEYKDMWHSLTGNPSLPIGQRALDYEITKALQGQLLINANQWSKSRLTSCADHNSGDWLKATPNRHVGLFLNDEEFRNAVSLRIGTKFFLPHNCRCGAVVDEHGVHCFACSRNNAKILRHTMVNRCVSATVASAGFQTRMEPTVIENKFGVRPDGMTIIPFKRGLNLAWDVSIPHPLCRSHLDTNKEIGALANQVERSKVSKYSCIKQDFFFSPIVIDTLGAYGKETRALIKNLARLLKIKTGNAESGAQFRQRLSIAIQKGNSLALTYALEDR